MFGNGTDSDCNTLFTNMKNRHKMSKSYKKSRDELEKYLKKVTTETKESVEGNSGGFEAQQWFYWTLGSHPGWYNILHNQLYTF